MKQFTRSEWTVLNSQQAEFHENQKAERAQRLSKVMEHGPVLGYLIDLCRHCLQAATKLYRDGFGTQTVVTALFHNVGFMNAPVTYGE